MIHWMCLRVFLQNVTAYTGIHISREPALSLVQDCVFLGQLSSPWDCFSQVRWADPAYSTGLVQEINRNVQIAFKWKGLVRSSRHSYYQTIGEFDLKVVWEYSWNPQEQIVSAFPEIRRENETSQRNSFSYSSSSCWIVLRLDLVQAGETRLAQCQLWEQCCEGRHTVCWLLRGEDGRAECLPRLDIVDTVSRRYLMHASGQ